MKARWKSRIIIIILLMLVHSAPGVPADDVPPRKLREALEVPLRARVAELLKIQNENGVSNVRGSYFERYTRVDGDTYQVAFHTRTAGSDELVAARSTLT